MIRTYRTELRRSPLRWWLPILIAADLAVLYGRGRWWIGVWPQASVAAQIPAFYFGPLFSALAAWSVNRASRRGLDEQLDGAARPRWHAESVQLAATLTYGVGTYLVGAAAAAIVSSGSAGPGFLWPSYILIGATTVAASAAIGHAVGRWSRSRFVAPMFCALACFVLLGSLGDALGLIVLTGPPNAAVASWPLATRVLLGIAALGVAVAVPGRNTRGRSDGRGSYGRGPTYAAVSAVVVFGACVVGYRSAGALQVDRPAPAEALCTQTTPSACLWPEDRKYLTPMAAMMTRVDQLPGGIFTIPPRFYELGLRSDKYKYIDFFISEGSLWDVATDIAIQIVDATFPNQCDGANTAANSKRFHAEYELGTWIESQMTGAPQPSSVHGGPPGVDVQAVGRLIYAPAATQLTWVQQHLATIRDTPCA